MATLLLLISLLTAHLVQLTWFDEPAVAGRGGLGQPGHHEPGVPRPLPRRRRGRHRHGWGEPRPATLAAQHVMSLDWSVSPGQDFDIWVDDVKLIDCK